MEGKKMKTSKATKIVTIIIYALLALAAATSIAPSASNMPDSAQQLLPESANDTGCNDVIDDYMYTDLA